jgi:FKBP-type peptidyl-prolyl cis-trans isomerase FklB
MAKIKLNTLYTTLAGLALLGSALAQETPAKSPTPAPSKTPPASTAKTPSSTTKGQKTATTAAKTALTTQKDKVSYAIGMNMGWSLRRRPTDLDIDLIMQGIRDQLKGKTLLTEDEARSVFMQWQAEMRAKQEEQQKMAADANKKEGEAFLAANKAKEGVVTLPSGLQYKILTAGTGPKPTAADSVSVHYRGTLINGKEFDSSAKHGGPATFPVSRVIRGWTEALQLMPVGSKWQLVIPAGLAYGERGAGEDIGPNATLVFEVELLSIQEKQPVPQQTPVPEKSPSPTKTPSPEKQ